MEPVSALTQGVDHVGLTVSNLESSRRFFCECLGWKTIGEVPSYPAAFVSDGVTRLTLWQVDQASDPVGFDRRKNIGLHHLALKVADLATLHEVFTRASNWPGVEVEFALSRWGKALGFTACCASLAVSVLSWFARRRVERHLWLIASWRPMVQPPHSNDSFACRKTDCRKPRLRGKYGCA